MEYRLKKDLPFAKAGKEIKFIRGNLEYPNITIELGTDNCLRVWCGNIEPILDDGWIEEVKPREFEIAVFPFFPSF